ncbi:MAG: hypothetical protein IPK64_18630 [bacterium]|nr:hypothetical protein [bacterium]
MAIAKRYRVLCALPLLVLLVACGSDDPAQPNQVAAQWQSLGQGMNDIVRSLVVFDGALIAGGRFTASGAVNLEHIARWDGTSWNPVGDGLGFDVYALATYNDMLIAAGYDGEGGGGEISAWDGISWSAIGPGYSVDIRVLAVHEGRLVVGGYLSGGAGGVARWDGTNWTGLGSGPGQGAYALASFGGTLVAGGPTVEPDHLARWDGSSWTGVGGGADDGVEALTVMGADLIAGGYFDHIGSVDASGVAAWNGSNWRPLGGGLIGNFGGLLAHGSRLFACGDLSLPSDQEAWTNVFEWDGSSWKARAIYSEAALATEDISGRALAIYEGALIVGGDFTHMGSTSANRIAKMDL